MVPCSLLHAARLIETEDQIVRRVNEQAGSFRGGSRGDSWQ
jgi:hypothetical protein